jgi:hypothetical protein
MMHGLVSLLIPTLVAAVAVFLLSSIVHMVLPWHKSDYPSLPNQDAAMDAIRALNIPPGEYMAPKPANRDDMKSAEFKAKMERGPAFILNVRPPGGFSLGKPLAYWFIYCLVVSFLAGHVAWGADIPAAETGRLFHTVGLSAALGYCVGIWQQTVWFGKPWTTTLKSTVDGLIYAVATAMIFIWLWPK